MSVRLRRLFPALLSILILALLLLAIFRDAAISVANRIATVFQGADSTSSSSTRGQAGISSTRAVEAGLLSEGVTPAGKRYYAVTIDLNDADLRLFYKNDSDEPFGGFGRLEKWLTDRNERLLFAMNAGIYDTAYRPLGLHIENGKIARELNLRRNDNDDDKVADAGNFYLMPNGVFLVENGAASVVESQKVSGRTDWQTVGLATQSGPLLVYDGHIHPVFKEDSKNFNIRNGVGVINAKTVVFIISRDPVSLYDFAATFKEDFHCDNALYLDGFISGFYLPELGQSAANPAPFVGILAVTSKGRLPEKQQ
jgi:uncharacterized protein YigE (DUF2233 family)